MEHMGNISPPVNVYSDVENPSCFFRPFSWEPVVKTPKSNWHWKKHIPSIAFVFWHNFALHILTWKCASRHNGVQLFISHLASWLRTRRFSKPTFRTLFTSQCTLNLCPFTTQGIDRFWVMISSLNLYGNLACLSSNFQTSTTQSCSSCSHSLPTKNAIWFFITPHIKTA